MVPRNAEGYGERPGKANDDAAGSQQRERQTLQLRRVAWRSSCQKRRHKTSSCSSARGLALAANYSARGRRVILRRCVIARSATNYTRR